MPTKPEPWFIVGGDGGIGAALARRIAELGLSVIAASRRPTADWRLDLADNPADWRLPERVTTAFLCAAITSMEQCRRDPERARLVNVTRTLELSHRLRERGAHLVFLSSNQVYDGTQPLRLADELPCPVSDYGRQKAEVERELLRDEGATVLRLTKVVPPRMELFAAWAAALRKGETIHPFDDLRFSPVSLRFCVDAIVEAGRRGEGGVVQVSGERDISYADVAFQLVERLGLPRERVQPVSRRSRSIHDDLAPLHTTLDTARLRHDWGMTVPSVASTLDELIEGAIHV